MEKHKIYLRIMLWSLGLAACLGVISVLFAAYDLMGRVIGTAVVVGVCSGLMIPLSKMADRRETRAASMLGMGLITFDFLLAMLLIWVEPIFGGHWFEEELLATLASLTFPGLFAVAFLASLHREAARLACRVGLVTSAVVVVFLIGATWCREFLDWWWVGSTAGPYRGAGFRELQVKLASTGLTISAYGLFAVAVLWGEKVGNRKWWRWGGVVGGILACAMWLVDIWVGRGSPLGEVICTALTAVAAVATYANIVGFVPLPATQAWLRQGCVACASVTAAVVVLYVAEESRLMPTLPEEQLVRLGAAGGILAACGSLAMAVLARLNRGVYVEESVTSLSDVELVCPRCRTKQKLPLGDSACAKCGLRINIRVEEPRCATCGYLLIGAVSDRCPECGTPVLA